MDLVCLGLHFSAARLNPMTSSLLAFVFLSQELKEPVLVRLARRQRVAADLALHALPCHPELHLSALWAFHLVGRRKPSHHRPVGFCERLKGADPRLADSHNRLPVEERELYGVSAVQLRRERKVTEPKLSHKAPRLWLQEACLRESQCDGRSRRHAGLVRLS